MSIFTFLTNYSHWLTVFSLIIAICLSIFTVYLLSDYILPALFKNCTYTDEYRPGNCNSAPNTCGFTGSPTEFSGATETRAAQYLFHLGHEKTLEECQAYCNEYNSCVGCVTEHFWQPDTDYAQLNFRCTTESGERLLGGPTVKSLSFSEGEQLEEYRAANNDNACMPNLGGELLSREWGGYDKAGNLSTTSCIGQTGIIETPFQITDTPNSGPPNNTDENCWTQITGVGASLEALDTPLTLDVSILGPVRNAFPVHSFSNITNAVSRSEYDNPAFESLGDIQFVGYMTWKKECTV